MFVSRIFKSHPPGIVLAFAGSAVFFTYNGVVDFNRNVKVGNYTQEKLLEYENIGEAMQNYHDLASRKEWEYYFIYVYRNYCDETRFVYERSLAEVDRLMKYYETEKSTNLSKEKADEMVASEYRGFVTRMARRKLIRNGNIIKWANAVIHDEIIKVFILPVFGFFVDQTRVK